MGYGFWGYRGFGFSGFSRLGFEGFRGLGVGITGEGIGLQGFLFISGIAL